MVIDEDRLRLLQPLRSFLDGLYRYSGYVAAVCLIVILVLIVMQMLARWTGEMLPGTPDYAGYFMAASSFFAFAYALNHGAHIRVNLLLSSLGRYRRYCEIWCFVIASVLSCYWTYYAIKTTHLSFLLGDKSQGLDATPLWIPQMAMAIGAAILSIALIDNLVRVLFVGDHFAIARTVEEDTG
ncbi:MAG: TRAP transporter small permease [Rhodobacteraceae bacterium]|nr:TRAP transporter small permease [Paracoccaceae bacterium]